MMPDPLMVEVIAYAPTAFYHCTHCEVAWRAGGMTDHVRREQANSSLPPDLAEDYQAISDWVREVFRRHGDRVIIKVVDAASLEGVFKTLRYGVRRYPAVIVGQQSRFVGTVRDVLGSADQEIDRRLQAAHTTA